LNLERLELGASSVEVAMIAFQIFRRAEWRCGEDRPAKEIRSAVFPNGTPPARLIFARAPLDSLRKNSFGRYSGFNSALYRKVEAKWHFSQENATSHDLQMETFESKPL